MNYQSLMAALHELQRDYPHVSLDTSPIRVVVHTSSTRNDTFDIRRVTVEKGIVLIHAD